MAGAGNGATGIPTRARRGKPRKQPREALRATAPVLDPTRWLVDNPIDRYSIGSATPGLKTAADGSISIYVQAKSPGQDKENNWLPAPDGPCWMVLRIYGPGESILDKAWKVPPVKALK